VRRFYDFPSLTALVCFEAAARHASFKQAAQELNVTPAAISHQIKALEAELKVTLFARQFRSIELTQQGAFLYVALQRGFETIADALASLRTRQEDVDVTVQSSLSVSALWLTPKISAFWKIEPEITVAQLIDYADGDNRTGGISCDLSIYYGRMHKDEKNCHKLFQGDIIAAATADFAARHNIRQLEDLGHVPLIHSGRDDKDWTSWGDWFKTLGAPVPQGRNFYINNYMIALQVAQEGVGAVLGWSGLIESLLCEGKLVQLVPESMSAPKQFYLRIHSHASTKARIFADWLINNAEAREKNIHA